MKLFVAMVLFISHVTARGPTVLSILLTTGPGCHFPIGRVSSPGVIETQREPESPMRECVKMGAFGVFPIA